MIHFCVFGGHGGELSPNKRLYVTVFGGCELKRPTIARQIVETRRFGQQIRPHGAFFLTLFGATEISMPTLAEEFLDLQDALRANLFTLDDWDRAVGQLTGSDWLRIGSFTAFGGFDSAALPSEDEELERLATTRATRDLPERATQSLMLGIGERGAQRPAAVRLAMAEALSA